MTEPTETRRPSPRGRLVEGVRLIFIALLATGAYQIGTATGHQSALRTALFVFLGSAVGYVVGGIVGRVTARTVTGMERELRRTPASHIAAGAAGLIVGLVISALVTFPLLQLPPAAAWPAIVFVYLTLSSLGFGLARSKADELFALFGLKPRAAGASRGEVNVIDTSALITVADADDGAGDIRSGRWRIVGRGRREFQLARARRRIAPRSGALAAPRLSEYQSDFRPPAAPDEWDSSCRVFRATSIIRALGPG